ncbi:hypothetical protein EYT00_24480 [Salmonella enterica]|nr:hypothetical protein [Salmonella enterica]EAR7356902.1 hypothetical protein [Salmonella enterica]
MKIDMVLNYKKFEPMIEGINGLPEKYIINIARSDERGLTEIELLTVLQTAIEGIKTAVKVKERESQ